MEWRSSRTSTVSIKGRISLARSNSIEWRGPFSTASSQTRFRSSSINRDAVGSRGSNRSNAAKLIKPTVRRPIIGVKSARSRRSSAIAPANSLPCVRARSATCGPALPESNDVTPGIPEFPAVQRLRSGGSSATSNSGGSTGGEGWVMSTNFSRLLEQTVDVPCGKGMVSDGRR